MDTAAFRWVLIILGLLLIAAIYGWSWLQSKQRRQAAVKTFTQEEIDSGFIEDEMLREELSSIETLMNDDLSRENLQQIKINPSLEQPSEVTVSQPVQLPESLCGESPDDRVLHLLRPADEHLLTANELSSLMRHVGFMRTKKNLFVLPEPEYSGFAVYDLSPDGHFADFEDESFTSRGLVCCICLSQCKRPLDCYEVMLKKIDELVRVLEFKVFEEKNRLLTLSRVTEIRTQLHQLQKLKNSSQSPGGQSS